MSHVSWEYKLTLFCGLCCVALLVLLAGEWVYSKQYRAQIMHDIFTVNKAGFDMQAIPTYPFSNIPVDHYAELVARPVFFESRKPIEKVVEPPAPTVVAPKAPVGEFTLILTGILRTPLGVKALFQNPKATTPSERNKRLAVDEQFEGWTLKEIQADKVILQADTETKELLLLKAKPKNPIVRVNSINPFAPPNRNTTPAPPAPKVQNKPPRNTNPFALKP